ncbi:beta strand repeat-containing protein [Ferruginibacter sp.]
MTLIKIRLQTILLLSVLFCNAVQSQTTSTDNTLNNTGVTAIQSTTSSNYQLSVGGAVKIFHSGNSGLSSASLYLLNTASSGREYFINSDNTGSFRIVDNTAGTSRFVIGNTGSVGIGTSSPAQLLDVNGNVNISGGGIIGNNTLDGAKLMVSDANRTLSGASFPSLMKILNSGEGPQDLLHLDNNHQGGRGGFVLSNSSSGDWTNNLLAAYTHGTSFTSNFCLLNIPGKTTDAGWNYIVSQGNNVAGMGLFNYNAIPLVLGTNNSARMTIAANGNVGIGTTSPTAQLHTTGAVRFSGLTNDNSVDRIVATDANGNLYYRSVSSLGGNTTGNWGLSGNAGTDPATNFIGTTDDKDIIFRRNGIQSGLLSENQWNTSFGIGALNPASSNPTGNGKGMISAYGYYALHANTSGYLNDAFGLKSLYSNTTGTYNVAMGSNSLYSNISGNDNTAVGTYALYNNTTGNENTAMGVSALYNNTTGRANIGLGLLVLQSNTTGNYNVGLGPNALNLNTTGINNIGVASQALYNNVTGSSNVAVGLNSLLNNTSGSHNIAIGVSAGDNLTSGENNIAIGERTTFPNVSGSGQLNIGNVLFGTGLTYNYFSETAPPTPAGSIGIGITSPTAQLHTTGTVRFSGLTNDNSVDRIVATDVNGNLYYRDASSLGGSSTGSWGLSGNAGTDPSTHFIGTTDNKSLSIKTNGIERISISNTGSASFKTPIGTSGIQTIFSINGGNSTWGNQLSNLFEVSNQGSWWFRDAASAMPSLWYNSNNNVIHSGAGIDMDFAASGQVIAKNVSALRLRGANWFQTEINIDRPSIEYKPLGDLYVASGTSAHKFTVVNPLTNANTNLASFDNGGTDLVTITKEGKVLIGTTNQAQAGNNLLAVNGSAIFTKATVKLNGNWPDYVFMPTYKPLSLTELEEYLSKNKHLPDVPSAEEVEKNGIDLGSNQTVLLKKVEELTLYMIELSKKVEALSIENQELKKKINNSNQ